MSQERIIRHKWPSRLLHWLMALSVLALLATGLLPVLGVKFEWLLIHWTAGLVLTAFVLGHIIRALFFQNLLAMGLGWRDVRALAGGLGIGRASAPKPGKYTLPQKLMHYAVAVMGLIAIATGLLMLRKIDTPFWKRDPYFLSEQTWGMVYVLHDLAALSFVTLIMLHVYFTLRPERWFYLRSMLSGWVTREELEQYHDPKRWKAGTSE
jgi:cytochrome b subunit of formate dehydrogenase